MSVSLPREIERDCSKCGHRFTEIVWLAIDLGERPDLRATIAERTLAQVSCPQCGNKDERPEPLLLLRAWEAAPLVQVSSFATLQSDSPFEDGRVIAEEMQRRLGKEAGDIPGPMLLAPWGCVALGLRRDLDTDVSEPERALREVRDEYGPDGAQIYSFFLRDIADSRPQRRLALAVRGLFSVTSAAELKALFEEFPELASEEARSDRAAWVHRARDEEELAVAEGQLELLIDAAAGDYDAAWASHEQRLINFSSGHVNPQLERLLVGLEGETDYERVIQLASDLLRVAEQIGDSGLEAEAAAELLTRSASGIGTYGPSAPALPAFRRHLDALVRVFVVGLGGRLGS